MGEPAPCNLHLFSFLWDIFGNYFKLLKEHSTWRKGWSSRDWAEGTKSQESDLRFQELHWPISASFTKQYNPLTLQVVGRQGHPSQQTPWVWHCFSAHLPRWLLWGTIVASCSEHRESRKMPSSTKLFSAFPPFSFHLGPGRVHFDSRTNAVRKWTYLDVVMSVFVPAMLDLI